LSRKLITWLALRGILLALASSMIMACAASVPPVTSQQPERIQTKSVLETCAVIKDEELAEMRGCYDTYSFGMTVEGTFDMIKNSFSFKTAGQGLVDHGVYENGPNVPSQLTINPTGTQVSFSNANVAYTAGVGSNSLGNGIMQVVQVVGQNIMVMADMSVVLNINGVNMMKPTAGNTLSTPALLGIIR
jgi:hypothetical protein